MIHRRSICALLATLVLAGCSGGAPSEKELAQAEHPAGIQPASTGPAPTADPRAAAREEVERTGPVALHFERSFKVTLTQAFVREASNVRFNFDNNCVSFGRDNVWLVFNGTAEAIWTPISPVAPKLSLEIWDATRLSATGGASSPARLEYAGFRTIPNSVLGLTFVIQPFDDGLVQRQDVQINIAFNYVGRPELPTQIVPCVYPEPSLASSTGGVT